MPPADFLTRLDRVEQLWSADSESWKISGKPGNEGQLKTLLGEARAEHGQRGGLKTELG